MDKEERDKIVLAGRKVGTVIEALTEDKGVDKLETYKVGLRATHIDELRKEREKEFAFVDDENTSPLDKLRALRDLQAELYKKEGYTGVLPELYVTDEPNSFAVDGKNGETRKIFISLNDLKRGNSSALLYAHENAHLIQTDKDEEIAKYAETKIGENKNKFTENEKEEYLSNLRKNVEIDKSLEEQFALARSIPESERENWAVVVSQNLAVAMGYRITGGGSLALVANPETDKYYLVELVDFGIGVGTPSIGYNPSAAYFPQITNPKELEGWGKSIGASLDLENLFSIGVDRHYNSNFKPIGLRISSNLGKNSGIAKSMGMDKMLGLKVFKAEIHGTADFSKILDVQEISKETLKKYVDLKTKQEELSNKDVIGVINYLKELEKTSNTFKLLEETRRLKESEGDF